ncbi:putative oxidoreductase YusZ [Diplogelasinospora grovesii]|uniref:Oxidoreductase YusZ n=1 Tax=Diplogelasinospora grovesii TaxID=303347 RepID=A0AAN6N2G8_9PEZI|nr:putative oxidoreductase YusZ [Diplogelasinospora grovesii]
MAPKRVWLITGASSGFGLELARVAASQGDAVIATSRIPDKIPKLHGVTPVALDHNEPLPKLKEAINAIVAIYGTIDIVVNNAAYVQVGTVEESSPEETLRQFQANTFGPINVYRALLPHMRWKGGGTFVTIGSMAAWYPMNGCNLYNASKAALRWLVIGLAEEIKDFGIRHCLIEPGFFRTGLLTPGANLTSTSPTNRLPAYEKLNAKTDSDFAAFNGNQAGDPVRGARIVYDVVTESGIAAGRELPGFFPLGSDASVEIAKTARNVLEAIKEWGDIASMSDF